MTHSHSPNTCSPFSLNLGTVEFDLMYDGIFLGTGMGTNTVVKPGPDNVVTLKGVFQKGIGQAVLTKIGTLLSNYLNGVESPVVAIGKSTVQEDGTEVSWLSKGFRALQLQVPFRAHRINSIEARDSFL
ncbi:hypothetical protein L218DRAFT_1027477 [Marasmius fiardii PR-910]|nr:hypothetical protein L218DRAFT_1027477 [Marasmius fiardii PR-910]